MKNKLKLCLTLAFVAITTALFAQNTVVKDKVVDVSCGQCQFKMKGTPGCDLALRLKGKAYFVDGKSISDFGDAHAKDGFCNAVRKAKVSGELVNGRFKASIVELVDKKK